MKKQYLNSVLAVGALLLAGCNSEEVENLGNQPEVLPDGRVEVMFAAGGGGLEEIDGTRASWSSSYDANIGISAYTEDGNQIFNGYSNVEYRSRHSNDSGWSFYPASTGIYYSADANERIRFSAYYPYQDLAGGNIFKVDLTGNFSETDELLWAGITSDSYNKESSTVPLNLTRQYSTIRILLRNGGGYESSDTQGATLTISDMPVKADFNVTTGECTVTETADMIFEDLGISAGWYVYILPTEAKTGRVVTVTLKSGESYTWDISDKAFQSGYFYEYHLRVNKTGSSFNLTIEDRENDIMGSYENIDLR